ncbi:hypothetical protein L6452_37727 [Arctium lappa]|uniref:Uncharacterized protein n=1 Tax=Arctium lappa TaxID=4217 RepID=A0ACB8Y4V1_ARCLA|nr:hypothetical protein L6452_37727 [Arctium lappa]
MFTLKMDLTCFPSFVISLSLSNGITLSPMILSLLSTFTYFIFPFAGRPIPFHSGQTFLVESLFQVKFNMI